MHIQMNLENKTEKKIRELYQSHQHLYDPLSDMQRRIKERNREIDRLKAQLREANLKIYELEKKKGDTKEGPRLIESMGVMDNDNDKQRDIIN